MNPIALISGYLANIIPSYPSEAVANSKEAAEGAVLWSGPAVTPDKLDEMLQFGVWGLLSLLVAIACFAWLGRFMWRTNARNLEDPERSRFNVVAITAATFSMIFALSGLPMIEATRLSGEAYLVTSANIVRISEHRRTEVQASAITSVVRSDDGIIISTAGGRSFEIVPSLSTQTDLESALRRTLEQGGKGLRINNENAG